MIFEKPSTRTRVSFETGVVHMGGKALFLNIRDLQLGRGEPLEDTARVLSRMVSVIIVRGHDHGLLEQLARSATVPVINALTDRFHPCQILADLQTLAEHRAGIAGSRVAWLGDGNNVCQSWINAAGLLGFKLVVATPPGFEPDAGIVDLAGTQVVLTGSPEEAATGADVVVTDTWASMGQEDEKDDRIAIFKPYQVNGRIMELARDDAVFMHCLPAYRGLEVTADVIDGPQSVVWDEAENRLHAQKALIEFLLRDGD